MNHLGDTNKMVRDTPRTDSLLTAILETHGHVGFLNCPPTWVAWARELERELNAANERIKRLEDAGDAAIHEAVHGREGDALEIWTKAKEDKQ